MKLQDDVKIKTITVEENEETRIDSYISNVTKELSRTAIQRLIEEVKITVNGSKIKPSYKVQIGDIIRIQEEKPAETNIKPQKIPLEILYEDKDLIIVNKPKGMVVHPANGNPDGTLVNAVMSICKESLSGIGGELRPGIVHRLDKNTSGAIIIAKNDKAHINLSNQLKNHEIKKVYIALVKGIVKENEATINIPIARSKQDRKKMSVDAKGKVAVTHFKVIQRFDDCTLLKVKLETGRTHQIRVHLSYIGHPIIGDDVYSSGKNKWNVVGQCLHAKSLDFKHPITGENIHVEAELPDYFKEILNSLNYEL